MWNNRGKWKIEVVPTDVMGNIIDVPTKKRGFHKTVIKIAGLSLIVLSLAPLSPMDVFAATEAAKAAGSASWDGLINAILGILDPVAKVFGLIAGLAIMTGNGKIGLERLFWLSVGYITARKVEVWISFLNSI